MVWSSPEQVVLDLSRLSLMDASDLRTVLALERQSVQQNARLELVAAR
jgi:anti-anti-sigma regulatory factor